MAERWAVLYRGGHVVTSEDVGGDPSLVPKRDVLAIVRPDENGQRIRWLTPYYIWKEEYGEFYEASQDALWFYLAEPGWKVVLFGVYVSDKEMNEALLRAGEFYKGQKTWRRVERPSEGR